MKKNLFFIYVLLILSLTQVFVRNNFADIKTFYETSKSTVVSYSENNAGHYDYSVLYNIGRLDASYDQNSQLDTYRTQHYLLLGGIPANSRINSIKLYFYIGTSWNGGFTFKVTKISGAKTYGDLWTEIGSSAVQASNIQYNASQNWVSNSTITTTVTNAINSANNALYLGSLSQSEQLN